MKWLLFLLTFTLTTLWLSQPVSAHYFEENNGIKIELHMPPSDRPKAGEPTRLEFDYKLSNGSTFDVNNCRCIVRVLQDNTTLDTAQITQAKILAGEGGAAQVNFPKVGQYKLLIEGRSNNGDFKNFSVTYEVEVRTVSSLAKSKAWSAGDVVFIGGGGLGVAGLIFYNILRSRSKRTKTQA